METGIRREEKRVDGGEIELPDDPAQLRGPSGPRSDHTAEEKKRVDARCSATVTVPGQP